jgi:tRNA pseudouridine55 synthase
VARLDGRTLTDDNTSEVIEHSEQWRNLSSEQVRTALQSQVGEIMQLPPQYSAKKISGERAYDIARRGDVATLVPTPVTIYDITLISTDLPDIEFEVECSSGTYIRSIARDVGGLLGTGGYLMALRRTSIGKHDVSRAVPADQLVDSTKTSAAALTPVQALAHLAAVELTAEQERSIRHGQSIEAPARSKQTVQLVREEKLVAIAEVEGTRLRPRKVFTDV